ncbi:MAG: GTP 3',8-cyclase MoaA [Candidatus Riflebacteria bacterium HGW-Riflebacteria-2]|nr:MAG: GTP 3',8-cyclase MoaA [Candidatus Riflebacteria bacterium HGW-Riflebacteria-2]
MFKYLRVSVTDRCNYRCVYCMPAEGVCKQSHAQIMRYEEILTVIKTAVESGVEQVRISGGEPLVRGGIVDFIGEVAKIPGLNDLTLTTNGALLTRYAAELKRAGLNRVNISLDSLNPETFRKITRVGNLEDVIAGIDAAIAAGLKPVKLNTVLIPGINADEILRFIDFVVARAISVRFIERMPFKAVELPPDDQFISEELVVASISQKYQLEKVADGSFGPSSDYHIVGSQAGVGFISSRSHPFCQRCTRLRLTSNGYLLPCLDSEVGVNIRGMTPDKIRETIVRLAEEKFAWHKQNACYASTFESSLSKIGG